MIRKFRLSCISASIVSLLVSSVVFSGNYAPKNNYKNEIIRVPATYALSDGLYLGVGVGYDSYRNGDSLTVVSPDGDTATWSTIINPTGFNAGGFIGYGRYIRDYDDLYLGIEAFGLGSNAQSSYELNAHAIGTTESVVLKTNMKTHANYGVSLMPGLRLNTSSLLYLRLGYSWANLNVEQTLIDDGVTIVDTSNSTTTHGFQYGLGIEAALYRMLSVRFEYNHTDYNSFETNLGSKIAPADNQLLVGVIYHFNKQPPMIAALVPCEIMKPGFYFGVAGGYDSYQILENITLHDTTANVSVNPELSVNGVAGGGILGFGMYFTKVPAAYLGLEVFGNGTNGTVSSEFTTQLTTAPAPSSVKSVININSNYGVGLLPGVKVNDAALLYARVGYNWLVVRSEEYFVTSGASLTDAQTNTVKGLNYGLGIEFGTFNNNLSVRTEYSHTNYSSFYPSNLKISPENNQYMLGIIYHFV